MALGMIALYEQNIKLKENQSHLIVLLYNNKDKVFLEMKLVTGAYSLFFFQKIISFKNSEIMSLKSHLYLLSRFCKLIHGFFLLYSVYILENFYFLFTFFNYFFSL